MLLPFEKMIVVELAFSFLLVSSLLELFMLGVFLVRVLTLDSSLVILFFTQIVDPYTKERDQH